jgi:hypothetical protein
VTPAEAIAVALCDTFFAASGQAARWATATQAQRQTFLQCSASAIAAGRAVAAAGNGDLEQAVAEAISAGFWGAEPAPARLTWAHGSPQVRALFLMLARTAISTGRSLRSQRAAQSVGVAA